MVNKQEVIKIKTSLIDENNMINQKLAEVLIQKTHSTLVLNEDDARYLSIKKGETFEWEENGQLYQYTFPHAVEMVERPAQNLKNVPQKVGAKHYHLSLSTLGEGSSKEVKNVAFDLKVNQNGELLASQPSKKVLALIKKETDILPEDINKEKIFFNDTHHKMPKFFKFSDQVDSYQSVLVMKKIPGQELDTILLEKDDKLGLADFLVMAHEIKLALNAFHRRGNVHHDLKPVNILFDLVEGKAHLIDFQYANKCDEKPTSGGTPAYAGRERGIASYQKANKQADYYSYGVILSKIFRDTAAFAEANDDERRAIQKVINAFTKEEMSERPADIIAACEPLDELLAQKITKAYANMTIFINATLKRLDSRIANAWDKNKKTEFQRIKVELLAIKRGYETNLEKSYQDYLKDYKGVKDTIQNVDIATLNAFKKGTILHFFANLLSSKPSPSALPSAKAPQPGFFKTKSMKVLKDIEKSFNRMTEYAPLTMKGG